MALISRFSHPWNERHQFGGVWRSTEAHWMGFGGLHAIVQSPSTSLCKTPPRPSGVGKPWKSAGGV